jgi:hypothetical protein
MGDGSSPRSLSRAGIRRLMGCQLPDAILHGKRSCRPHSRAVQSLPTAGLLSEASGLVLLVVAPPAHKPGARHACDFACASGPSAPGRPPLLTVRLPGATGLTSYLSGCLPFTGHRFPFEESLAFREFFTSSALLVASPSLALSLSRLSASLDAVYNLWP